MLSLVTAQQQPVAVAPRRHLVADLALAAIAGVVAVLNLDAVMDQIGLGVRRQRQV